MWTAYALDPIWNRPLGFHPEFIVGLEMNRFLEESGATVEDCDRVAAKNRTNALANPIAAYPARITAEDVALSPDTFTPMREMHQARRADGAVVLVLVSEERARKARRPVWITGTGWANDTPTLESRPWGRDAATRKAAEMAFAEAGINDPGKEVDFFEVERPVRVPRVAHAGHSWRERQPSKGQQFGGEHRDGAHARHDRSLSGGNVRRGLA